MTYKNTFEAILTDINEAKKLIERFKTRQHIPYIEMDLALSKFRNIYELLLMLQHTDSGTPESKSQESGVHAAATGSQESGARVPANEGGESAKEPETESPQTVRQQPEEAQEEAPSVRQQAEQAPEEDTASGQQANLTPEETPSYGQQPDKAPDKPEETPESKEAVPEETDEARQQKQTATKSNVQQQKTAAPGSAQQKTAEPAPPQPKAAEPGSQQQHSEASRPDEAKVPAGKTGGPQDEPESGRAAMKEKQGTGDKTGTKKEILADKYHQQDVRNESMARSTRDISQKMQKKPIADIRKAIGINDRFYYIRELFHDSNKQFQQTIEELNTKATYRDAMAYLQENFDWDYEHEAVKKFLDLLQRKYGE